MANDQRKERVQVWGRQASQTKKAKQKPTKNVYNNDDDRGNEFVDFKCMPTRIVK